MMGNLMDRSYRHLFRLSLEANISTSLSRQPQFFTSTFWYATFCLSRPRVINRATDVESDRISSSAGIRSRTFVLRAQKTECMGPQPYHRCTGSE